MGLAVSMLADPEWEHILLESVTSGGFLGKGAAAKVESKEDALHTGHFLLSCHCYVIPPACPSLASPR